MGGVAQPRVVSREAWLAARLELLEAEKALTREKDRVNALRRRLPMVRVRSGDCAGRGVWAVGVSGWC